MALVNLQTLRQQFDQLEPLPAQSSPGTKKSYSEVLKAINNRIAQVSDASGINLNPPARKRARLAQNDEIDTATQDLPQDPPSRYQKIIASVHDRHQHRISVEDLKLSFLTNLKSSNLDIEQDSLRRLVTGYENATVDDVRDIFPEEIRPLNREWKAYCDNSTDADEEDDLTERLISRDKSTFNALKSDKVGSWVDYVLQSIDDIKFAGEFAEVNNSFKKSYVDTACATIMELDLDDAKDDDAKEKIKKDFKNRHRATVTARNQLYELYYNFGPAVFLDPSLMKTGRNGKPSYTKTYSATVDHLIENIPRVDQTNPEPYVSCLRGLQENNKKMLINMLHVLGGSEVACFVRGFIESNPPTVC